MEISEEGPDFGLVSTRMVSVLKPVTSPASPTVPSRSSEPRISQLSPAVSALFVNQGENHSKEKRENDPPHMSFSVGEHGFRSGLESCCAIAGQRLSGHVLSRCSWHASGYGGGSSYLLRRTVIVRS